MLFISGNRGSGRLLLLAIASILVYSIEILAQSGRSAVIRVTALDESDKPVAGALVEAKLKALVVETTLTNEKGEAELTRLSPGTFEIAISKESFEPLNQSDIALTA